MHAKEVRGLRGMVSVSDYQTGVRSGWHGLVQELCDICAEYNIVVWQVKEKWGELCFYIGAAPDWIHDTIRAVEEHSTKVCENCGAPGKIVLTEYGWYKTLCSECKEKEVTNG